MNQLNRHGGHGGLRGAWVRAVTATTVAATTVAATAIAVTAIVTTAHADAERPDNLDHLWSSYQSQGLKINRLTDGAGDWGEFLVPNFLTAPADETGEAMSWHDDNGFSIALEEPADADDSPDLSRGGSPNLVMSWQGAFAGEGRYRVSALGRKLEVRGVRDGVDVDDKALGWGVRLAGGWRFGDLFAALRVTLGEGLGGLFGSEVAVSENGAAEPLASFGILPSLNYALGKTSDLSLSLGRFEADGEADGADTLDTINLGYTWNPWPSARIGVEVVGKDFDGAVEDEDSTEIKISAEKRF